MKCPYCDFQDSKVIDSRSINGGVRRRRECLQCKSRFTTHERLQANSFLVIKKDGRREEFNRDKLIKGVHKACTKRAIASETIERMIDRVESELHRTSKLEVSSSKIGGMVMDYLRELDRIAYIRFASVYRQFADVEHFKQEVDALVRSGERVPSAQLPLIPKEESINIVKYKGNRKTGRGDHA